MPSMSTALGTPGNQCEGQPGVKFLRTLLVSVDLTFRIIDTINSQVYTTRHLPYSHRKSV